MNDNKFTYKYSAPTQEERREIEDMKRRYGKKTESEEKLEKLRRLDAKARRFPQITALTLGVVGVLIFGGGLALVLEIGEAFWGVVLAACGCIPTAAAYPVFDALTKRNKKKYSEEILRLSEELLGEDGE